MGPSNTQSFFDGVSWAEANLQMRSMCLTNNAVEQGIFGANIVDQDVDLSTLPEPEDDAFLQAVLGQGTAIGPNDHTWAFQGDFDQSALYQTHAAPSFVNQPLQRVDSGLQVNVVAGPFDQMVQQPQQQQPASITPQLPASIALPQLEHAEIEGGGTVRLVDGWVQHDFRTRDDYRSFSSSIIMDPLNVKVPRKYKMTYVEQDYFDGEAKKEAAKAAKADARKKAKKA